MAENLLFRCDSSPAAGSGHTMRCLALAEACSWARCAFASREILPALAARITERDFGLLQVNAGIGTMQDADETVTIAKKTGAGWVVVDGYRFEPAYIQTLAAAGLRILLIDDFGQMPDYRGAGIILNQNIFAHPGLYPPLDKGVRLLTGPRYALLRSEFLKQKTAAREIPATTSKILVSLGGADEHRVTDRVIAALIKMTPPQKTVRIILGSGYAHAADTAQLAQSAGFGVVNNAANMAEQMAWADLMIAGGGTTSLEAAAMGLPLLQIILAENQRRVAGACEKQGLSVSLGDWQDLAEDGLRAAVESLCQDQQRRAQMSASGMNLVDRRGAKRVACYLRADSLRLRPAEMSDARLLWHWANDTETRQNSFDPAPISWESHQAWLRAKLADTDARLWIAETRERMPFGQVRFDNLKGECKISVSLGPEFRGQGLGSALILTGALAVFESGAADKIWAYIKQDNFKSIEAHMTVGFGKSEELFIKGQPAVKLVFGRQEMNGEKK